MAVSVWAGGGCLGGENLAVWYDRARNDASPSFQVAGQVATVTAVPGAQVTAGETLARSTRHL